MNPRLALLMLVPPVLWAGNAVLGRLVADSISPMLLNFLRWALAGLLLWPLARGVLDTPGGRAALKANWRYLAPLGLLGMGAYNALQYAALHTSTPVNTSLIAASGPVWMLLIGALFFGERPRGRQLLGAAGSVAGVAIVLGRGDWDTLMSVRLVQGDLLMVAATLAWCGYSWLLARPPAGMQGDRRPDWDWAQFLIAQICFGWLWSGSAAAIEAVALPAGPVLQPSVTLFAVLLYVAICPSLLAYRAWGIGVAQAGPQVAALFANLTPLFAALLGAAVLGEAPQGYHAAAFACIVAGILVSSRR